MLMKEGRGERERGRGRKEGGKGGREENMEYLGTLGNSMCRDYIAGITMEGLICM